MIFTPIDIIISLLLLYFMVNGARKGFIKEISRIIAILSGIYFANKMGEICIPYIEPYINYEPLLYTVSYFTVFIIIVFIIGIIAASIQKFFEFILLGWLNRLLGVLIGLLKGLIVVSLVIFTLEKFPQTESTFNKLDNESILFQICNVLKNNFITNFDISEKTNATKTKLENYLEDNPIIKNPINP